MTPAPLPAPIPNPVPTPAPLPPSQLGPLDAVNELLSLPWSGYIPAMAKAQAQALVNSLQGKVLAQNKGSINESNYWDFALTLTDVSAPIDLTSPPGFSRILPMSKDAGFTLEAPLNGVWSLGFQGKWALSSKVVVAGEKVWSASAALPWNLTLSIKIQATVRADGADPNWPIFTSVSVTPSLALQATEPIPLQVGTTFQVTVKPGLIQFKAPLTDLSVGIGDEFSAGLDVTCVVDVTPAPTFGFLGVKGPTADFKFALDGALKFNLPNVAPFSTSGLSADFGLPIELSLPIPEMLSEYLWLLESTQLPIQVGLNNPNGAVPASLANFDFASPAQSIEAQCVASHIPYNAIFAIEHERAVTLPMWSALHHYADEEDSALWTGFFLAAASFQYAATSDPAALQLVKQLLDGVDRLFTVCTDAVVKNGVRSAVPVVVTNGVRRSGFFARSVLPDDSPVRWWQADDSIANNNRAFYEQPEGGWEVFVPGHENLHFNTYAELQASLDQIPIPFGQMPLSESAIRPVGRVWCGVGAGGSFQDATTDHQLSRDQIIGICFGLFIAWSVVSDPSAKERAADRLTELIGYIVDNKWNVPLPPDISAVCTSYLGAFDHQLALLRVGATVNPGQFSAAYDKVKAASQYIWISEWTSVLDPLFEYYKMNLSHAAIVPLLLAESDATVRQNYLSGYNILRQATAHHRNAWFNVANILIQPPSQRATYVSTAKAGSNPALLLTEEIKSILEDWLTRRGQVKEPNGLPTDAVSVANAQAIAALWNTEPAEVELYTPIESLSSSFYISRYARAVSERMGGIMEFTWQNDS